MTLFKNCLIAIFLFFVIQPVVSQEAIGLRQSNYGGIHSSLLNPASNVRAPIRWDINIVAGGLFVENNYAYFEKASLITLLKKRNDIEFANSTSDEVTSSSSSLKYNFFDDGRKKQAYFSSFVMGPSVSVHVRDQSFGLYFSARTAGSANRISSVLGYYRVTELEDGETFTVNPFKSAEMSWGEVGINYGRMVYENSRHSISAGVNFKYLMGFDAVFFQNHSPVNITKNGDNLDFENGNAGFGLASGISYENDDASYQFQKNGNGAAVDLGAVFKIKKDEFSPDKYIWKFGVSLLDFGKISFKKNTQAHQVVTSDSFRIFHPAYQNLSSEDEFFQYTSNESLDNPFASYSNNRFSLWMPAGISLQAELAVLNDLYVNATLVRRLRFKKAGVERENIISITPRFERRWFEVYLPVVLYNDRDLRFGTAFRLGFFTIGTDNLPSLIIPSKFSGTDIYFALKINPFKKNKKLRSGGKGSGKSKNHSGGLNCYY